MKNLLLLLLLSAGISQVTLTDEEVINLTNKIQGLQIQVDSLTINDSLKIIEIDLLYNKIDLLEEENKLLEKKVKLVKSSWYENKWLYFGYGATLSYAILTITNQIEGLFNFE
jgi:hypothetical protein